MNDQLYAGPTELPLVVVAGRPNVGKSSLVNRIVGRRVTVVQEEPGVTRDRKALDADWNGVPFRIVDTGGWALSDDALDVKIRDQSERAVKDAALVLFVTDVTVGVTEEDLAAARTVQRTGVPVRLVVNKVDDANREAAAWELVSLGLGDPWPVSALHGRGTGDLLDEVTSVVATPTTPVLDQSDAAWDDLRTAGARRDPVAGEGAGEAGGRADALRIALVGRPNVGKSTLFNRLIGEDRSIVHDLPGTTRDAIDTLIETPEGPLRFIDTAGMRRPARTERGTESYAVFRALQALETADLALLVIDGTMGPTHQDQRLAERIGTSGCPAVVVLNKWDLVQSEQREDVFAAVADRLAFLGDAPVLRISASRGRGVQRVLPALRASIDAYQQRVPTGALNRAIRDIQSAQPAPGARIRYAVQGAAEPPTFTLFTSGRLPATYLRYVERGLRERLGFGPTPMKLRVRAAGGR